MWFVNKNAFISHNYRSFTEATEMIIENIL